MSIHPTTAAFLRELERLIVNADASGRQWKGTVTADIIPGEPIDGFESPQWTGGVTIEIRIEPK